MKKLFLCFWFTSDPRHLQWVSEGWTCFASFLCCHTDQDHSTSAFPAISGVYHSSSSVFPAISLGFITLLPLHSQLYLGFTNLLPLHSQLYISLGFTILLPLHSQLYLWGSPFFFLCIPSYISGVRHSCSSVFQATSLGFPILGEIFAYMTVLFQP